MKRHGDTIKIPGDYQYNAINSKFIIQRLWHKFRLNMLKELLQIKKGEKVLELGCGSGFMDNEIAKLGAIVTGIDWNRDAIDFAGQKFKDTKNLNFIHGKVDDILFPEGTFDKIFCLEVIEHLYEDQVKDLMIIMNRYLIKKGRLLISTPNYKSHWPVIEYIMDLFMLAPKQNEEQHVSHFTCNKLIKICSECGFKIIHLKTIFILTPFISIICGENITKKIFDIEKLLPFNAGCNIQLLLEKN
jgi:2-polyprenyl-3-methyl-5-hydroxy-6-metoxy-1,4-benzoquinol methylase